MTLVQLPTTVSEIRDYMVNEIKNNILGPRSNDEKIPFNPKDEYFAGILFPNNWELDNEEGDILFKYRPNQVAWLKKNNYLESEKLEF